MPNDSLARGAKSHQFPSLSHISDEKWAQAFSEPEKKSGKHFKRGEAPAGTPAELIDWPAKKTPKLKTVWSKG
jgi:hypothetical protein